MKIRVNNQHGAARQAAALQAIKAVRKAVLSMPGKLLGLSIGFVMLAEILIFFPSAANYRSDWLIERTDDAYLASLAVETADEMGLGDEMIANLLTSADAVIVGRVYDGMNVPLLARPGGIGAAPVREVMLAEENLFERIFNTIGVFLAPEGRYLLIIDEPMAGDVGLVSVVVPEAGLKADLLEYSGRVLWLSIFIAMMTGGLIYLCLMFMFVRPMRKLAQAMTQFQQDPGNPACTVSVSHRSDEIGEAESALAAMQDEVRTAFRQRERLAALGGAVARINHDLRNVLTSAQLISDRLATNADDRVAAMGARLVRAVDRGIRLCEDTLQYGRSEERPPELQPVWLRAALDDAAGDAFAASGAADWRNEIDESQLVQADPDHLHRIFLNLFRNALQAMEKSDSPLIQVRARLSREGEHVLVEVCDAGPGVPDRIAETLFEPFGRTGSKGGSGLGLSIVRELARVMGGDVYLKTRSEPGAVFEVRLPAMGG